MVLETMYNGLFNLKSISSICLRAYVTVNDHEAIFNQCTKIDY